MFIRDRRVTATAPSTSQPKTAPARAMPSTPRRRKRSTNINTSNVTRVYANQVNRYPPALSPDRHRDQNSASEYTTEIRPRAPTDTAVRRRRREVTRRDSTASVQPHHHDTSFPPRMAGSLQRHTYGHINHI